MLGIYLGPSARRQFHASMCSLASYNPHSAVINPKSTHVEVATSNDQIIDSLKRRLAKSVAVTGYVFYPMTHPCVCCDHAFPKLGIVYVPAVSIRLARKATHHARKTP